MNTPHQVVVSVPFWRTVGLMTVAVVAWAVGAVWVPKELSEHGLMSHGASGLLMVGLLIGGTLALIAGLAWAAARAGPPGAPQLPGTVLAEVRVEPDALVVGHERVPWGDVLDVVWMQGRPDARATSAIPHPVGDAAVTRQAGAIVVELSGERARVLAPTSRDAGDALAAELRAALAAHRAR